MGALVQLSSTDLEVEPGRSVSTTVTVRNNGSVVDRFSFEAVGGAASWVTFSPDTLSLFPEASGTVEVTFQPPRQSSVVAGPMPYGIRVVSTEDPAGSVVEEGTLQVGAFSDVSVELLPRVASGRRSARTQLVVDNRSNCSYRAELAGVDPGAALALRFNSTVVDVPPGGASFIKVRIRPAKTFWRGQNITKPFRVTLNKQTVAAALAAPASVPSGDGAVPMVAAPPAAPAPSAAPAALADPHPQELHADGSMLQGPLLPPWLTWVAAALAGLLAIFAILWFLFFRPQIRSTARSEVKSQLAANGITPAAGSSNSGKSAAGSSPSGSGAGSSSNTVAGSTGTSSSNAAGLTVNGSSQAAGNGTQTIFTVPTGHILQVTDLLVQNAAGDTGQIAIARDGTVLMQWALANFRDLDYHWIAPTVFGAGTKVQMIVSGCAGACHPGIYYAGNLVTSG